MKYPFLPGASKKLKYSDLDLKVIVDEIIDNKNECRQRIWLLKNGIMQLSVDLTSEKHPEKVYSLIPLPEGETPDTPFDPKSYRPLDSWKTEAAPIIKNGLLSKSKSSIKKVLGVVMFNILLICLAAMAALSVIIFVEDFTFSFSAIFKIFLALFMAIACLIGFVALLFTPFSLKIYDDRFVKDYTLIPGHSKTRYWREFDNKILIIKRIETTHRGRTTVRYCPFWRLMKDNLMAYELNPEMLNNGTEIFSSIPLPEKEPDYLFVDEEDSPVGPPPNYT